MWHETSSLYETVFSSTMVWVENNKTIYLFSRLFDVSTSSCAHLTITFFFHLSLSFQSPPINPFSPNNPLIPSAQLALGLPRFLLPGGLHFITFFGSLPSSILWTCPYHFSCVVVISYKRDLVTFIYCLIMVFLILSFLEIRADRRQKSISVEFSFDVDIINKIMKT